MKYLNTSFSSGANSQKFRKNYDKIFKKPRTKKKETTNTEIFKCGHLPEPEHERGYPWSQLEREMQPGALRVFGQWMRGQTMGVDEKTGQGVIYAWDLERWVSQRERWRGRGVDRLPDVQDLVDWD